MKTRDIPTKHAQEEFKKKTIGLVRSHNLGRRVPRLTLADALSEARKGMTQDERRELLINSLSKVPV